MLSPAYVFLDYCFLRLQLKSYRYAYALPGWPVQEIDREHQVRVHGSYMHACMYVCMYVRCRID
jgi:hypothetical protein